MRAVDLGYFGERGCGEIERVVQLVPGRRCESSRSTSVDESSIARAFIHVVQVRLMNLDGGNENAFRMTPRRHSPMLAATIFYLSRQAVSGSLQRPACLQGYHSLH